MCAVCPSEKKDGGIEEQERRGCKSSKREEGGGEVCSSPNAPLRNLLAEGLGALSTL